jgi:hypothetical protein
MSFDVSVASAFSFFYFFAYFIYGRTITGNEIIEYAT